MHPQPMDMEGAILQELRYMESLLGERGVLGARHGLLALLAGETDRVVGVRELPVHHAQDELSPDTALDHRV